MSRILAMIIGVVLCSSLMVGQSEEDTVRYQLQPVTVTSTRTSVPWVQVPLAIQVLEMKDVHLTKGYGLDEALTMVPGVLVQSRYGNQDVRLTIRGYGARGAGERSNAGTSRGIRVLSDGIPETEPDGRTSFDLIDLSSAGRIEVIRSNASALWGNASGGVINISSNTGFSQPYFSLGSLVGSYGFRKQTAQLGSQVGDGKLYLSFSNTTSDGWREHTRSAQTLLRTGIVSPLGEATQLGVHLAATTNFFQIPGPLTQAQFDSNPRQAQRDSIRTPGFNPLPSYIERDERRLNRLGRIGLTLSHQFDASNSISATTYATPKYLQRSERNTFRDFNRYNIGGSFSYQNSGNLGEQLRHSLIVGVDESYQDGAIQFYDLVQGERGTNITDNKREGANTFGAFLQEELTLNDALSLTLGGRWDNVTYYSDSYIDPKLNARKSFKHFTPKAGVNYRFTTTHSVYANLGGGVEVPAGNETDPTRYQRTDTLTSLNPLLEAINSTTLEVGTKQVFTEFDDASFLQTIMYDVAFYHITVRNDVIPYSGGRYYLTAGKTRRSGIEVGVSSALKSGFSIQAALTYSRNRFVDYVIDSLYISNNSAAGSIRLDNNKFPGVPDVFYSLGLKYVPTWLQEIFGEVRVRGVGSYFVDDLNRFTVPSYNVLDAGAGIENVALASQLVFNARIGIDNLTDRVYVASAFINPDYSNGSPAYLEPGIPRTVVGNVSIGWRF